MMICSGVWVRALGALAMWHGLSVATLFANGGGYHYGTKFTGSIAPFTASGTENVQILDEKLDIILDDKVARVSVLYQMKNVTDKPADVRFGFPVEDVDSQWDAITYQSKTTVNEPRYTKGYVVALNGKVLAHRFVPEPFGSDKKPGLKPFKGSEVLKEIKGWQVSEMRLKAGETVSLHITYHSQYDEESASISEDVFNRAQVFKYRLSTGAVWHGPIKKGRVTVSYTSALDPKAVRVEKPVNRFKKVGDKFVWEFENLEPSLADDLKLQAKPEHSEYAYHGEDRRNLSYYKFDQRWFLKHVKFSIKASSTLPNQGKHHYAVSNLKAEWEHIWSEGAKGQGIGESITLTLNKPAKVAGIVVHNGYGYDKELYAKNSRVKAFDALINGQHKVRLNVRDTSDSQQLFFRYDKPVKTIQLSIKDVYPGSKYQDTCLSFLGVIEPLDKEPKSYGAR